MHLFSVQVVFYLFVLVWDENNSTFGQECGAVVNNTLTSPGFPNNYPRLTYCTYWVPVPEGTSLMIDFEYDLENETKCRYDYLKITDEKGTSLGLYCGKKTKETVEVTGEYAVITFHSDTSVQRKGFSMLFRVKENGSNAKTIEAPKVVLPAPAIRYYQGYRLSCSATGIPPVNIAIMRDMATLVNATNTASFRVYEEGNYKCQASSKYGNDKRHFRVDDLKDGLVASDEPASRNSCAEELKQVVTEESIKDGRTDRSNCPEAVRKNLIVDDEESQIPPNTKINTPWTVRTWSEWAVGIIVGNLGRNLSRGRI